MQAVVLGNGSLGRAIAAVLAARGDEVRSADIPATGRHEATLFAGADVVFDATAGAAVRANVEAALDAGVRHFVIGTTAWDADRTAVAAALTAAGADAVAAANLSLGMALFGRLVDDAVARLGALADWDPYLVEWHRRPKPDRPSGTARALATRIIAGHPRITGVTPAGEERTGADQLDVVGVRAGSNPGSHLVGFDGPGECIELRHTARDRSAYAAGAVAAADWLMAETRAPGLHSFEPVVDGLLAAGTAREVANGSV